METKPDDLIELTPLIIAKCEQFGRDLVDWYERQGPRATALSSHGIEKDPDRLCDTKIAECIGATFFDLDLETVIKWSVEGGPDEGADFPVDRTRVDVKRCDMHKRYLIWPASKVKRFDGKQFDVLLLVKDIIVREHGKVISARGLCRGWIGKASFRAKALKAPVGHFLDPGTPHMHENDLHRMGIFPGRSDDPREHYCWCGEFGAHGNQVSWLHGVEGEWNCLKHKPPPLPVPPVPPRLEPASLQPTQGSLF